MRQDPRRGPGTGQEPAAKEPEVTADERGAALRAADGRGPSAPAAAAAAGRRSAWRPAAVAAARRHWLIGLLLAAGLALRVIAQLAYNPALLYVDSLKYLYDLYPGSDPLGYKVPVKIILVFGNLRTVTLIQHLLGLAMAVTLYAVLQRRGVNRWLAAAAVAPVLLDAYELQMESVTMPDAWFEAMVVAGLALLLWRPLVPLPLAAAAGLVLGASATMRQVGELLVFPAVLFLLAAGGGWRRALARSAVLVVAFALPIAGYCGINYARTHHFWLARGQSMLGRAAAAADCATLRVPPPVKAVCPTPAEQARGPDWLEHSAASPLYARGVQPASRAALLSAVEHQQPLRIAAAVLRDSVRLFALTRDGVQSVTPISRWQFQDRYPSYPQWITIRNDRVIIGLQRPFGPFHYHVLRPSWGGKVHADRPLASFLRGYQLDGGYAPGPLLALCVLAGLAGSALLLARRRSVPGGRELAAACLLFTAAAFAVLAVPDVYEFSWRYELPAVIALPPAGALGAAALAAYLRPRGGPAGPAGPAADR